MSYLLLAILTLGLCVQWVDARWAWGAEQVAIFLFAIGLAIACAAGRRVEWHRSLLLPAGTAAIGCIQLAARTTVDRWATSEQVLTWFAWLAAMWVALQVCADDRARMRFLRAAACVAIALAVIAILHRTTSGGKVFWWFETGRSFVMGVFPYENQYAAFVLLMLPVVLLQGWWLGGAVLLASAISSSSVAGATLVVLEFAVVAFAIRQRVRLPMAKLAAIAVVAVAIGFVGGWSDMLKDLERRNPLELRRTLTASTIEMARDRAAGGWGLGTWTEVYPAYARFDDGVFDNAAHNDWAQWAAEGGVALALLMAIFFAMTVRVALRSPIAIGLVLVLVYDLIEFHFAERPAFGCFYFAMAAAMFALDLRDRNPHT